MTDILPFHTMREYKRIYSIVKVTSEGIFKDGEVPDDYNGDTELTVEVVHEILLTDAAGRLERKVYAIPEALDRNRENGGGYELEGSTYQTSDFPSTAGPSSAPTVLYIKQNPYLSSDNILRAEEMVRILGGWPIPSEV